MKNAIITLIINYHIISDVASPKEIRRKGIHLIFKRGDALIFEHTTSHTAFIKLDI